MDKVRKGLLPWMNLDQLHRLILDELLAEFNITGLTEEEKKHWNHVWHRLSPWPDAVEGITRLKQKFIVSTLSNGNVSLLVEATAPSSNLLTALPECWTIASSQP